MTKYAENEATENAKRQLEESKNAPQARVAAAQLEMGKGKATPTQEELDMAMLGAHIIEHDDDGSGPDPYQSAEGRDQTRQLEADKRSRPQEYQTKASTGKAPGKSE